MSPQLDIRPPHLMHTDDVIIMTEHGATVSVQVSSADTAGAATVINYLVPPHDPGPLPHWHSHTSEWWWVLQGTLAIAAGDETITAGEGTSVFIPPGTIHTFWNPTATPVTFLALMSPGGLERYFIELSTLHDIEPRLLEGIAVKYDVLSPASL